MTFPSRYAAVKFNDKLISVMSLSELTTLAQRCDAYFIKVHRAGKKADPRFTEICGTCGYYLNQQAPQQAVSIREAFNAFSKAYQDAAFAGYEVPLLCANLTDERYSGAEVIADIQEVTRVLCSVLEEKTANHTERENGNAVISEIFERVNAKYR